MKSLRTAHADAHDDGAFDLVAPGEWVEDAAGIDDRDHTAHAQPGDFRLPGDLHEMRAERVAGKLRLRCTPNRSLGAAQTGHRPEIAHPQKVRKRNAARRGFALGVYESVRVFELRGLSPSELRDRK